MATILIIIATIILIPFIGAAFIKKEYTIARDIVIDASPTEVYDYLRFLNNQDHFSKWVMTDPDMTKFFRGTDGSVGSVYGWNGNKKAGEGEQEIIGLQPNKMIDVEVRFVRPFKNIARTPFYLEAVEGNKTKVRWSMIGKNQYPFTLMNLFIDKLLGPDLEISLKNLKNILEKQNVTA